jgi:hypothetical protein
VTGVSCSWRLTRHQESTPNIPETSAPGEVEPVIEEPEEAGSPVQGRTETKVHERRVG